MKKASIFALFTLALIAVFSACQDDDFVIAPQDKTLHLPQQVLDYTSVQAPQHFDFMFDNTPNNNRVTDHGATLGRVLFYDTKLSVNNVIACASCHHQENGFADPVAFSEGFNHKKTRRNSMAIFNSKHNAAFFWDQEVEELENQVLMPIKDHIEMGIENLTDLEQKLGRIAYYPALFSNAFGSDEITSDRIASAMAQFIRSIVSYNTKYDRGQADAFSNFTDLERRGFTIFTQAECDGCHGTQNFGGIEAANIGLEMNYADKGIGDLLGSDQFNGSFKVPSLRNVALTAPYMHDGRFATLEEVIQHYSEAIVAHPNLDFRLTTQSGNGWSDIRPSNSPILHFEFTPLEVEALIAFLHTLTDDVLTTDEKYSNPFR